MVIGAGFVTESAVQCSLVAFSSEKFDPGIVVKSLQPVDIFNNSSQRGKLASLLQAAVLIRIHHPHQDVCRDLPSSSILRSHLRDPRDACHCQPSEPTSQRHTTGVTQLLQSTPIGSGRGIYSTSIAHSASTLGSLHCFRKADY